MAKIILIIVPSMIAIISAPGNAQESTHQVNRFIYCYETTDGQRLDDERIKEMTGGDTITGRIPYATEALEFQPNHKLVIAGNHAPIIVDDGIGLWRRMILFPFSETSSH